MLRSLTAMCIAVLLLAGSVCAAPIATGDLSELIDLERAAYLRDSVCEQVSSYDPSGLNDDGFSGAHSFLRKEGEDFVIFDAQGPGCIYRIWSANPGKGWIKFYFDGEETPRLHFDRWEDMFTSVKLPFVPPLSQHFIGGWCSYVPLPFAKSLKIVAKGPVRFLQFTWHKFASGDGARTFDPNLSAEDRTKLQRVALAWRKLGDPPVPFPIDAKVVARSATAAPRSTCRLARLDGAGLVRAIRLKIESEDTKLPRKALLLVNVDGQSEPNVYSPVGDFFLDPFGGHNAQSLLTGKKGNTYYSYFVMPYASGAVIKIKNDSGRPARIDYEIVYEPLSALPAGIGRFYAWWHRQNPTVDGELFPILDAVGRGHWMGISHAMRNSGRGIGFLEGDEMLWIDGRDNSHYNGTGTEDYFNGGWYFRTPGSAALYGCGALDNSGECHAYRIHLTDLVPFQQKARIGIEHGRESKVAADYAGVTYWYAAPGTRYAFKATPVADRMNGPSPVKNVIEAERIGAPESKRMIVSDLDHPYYLSGGNGVASGDRNRQVTLLLDAPEPGRYQLELGLLKGPDGGVAEVLVDGQPIAGGIDAYSAETRPLARERAGVTHRLEKGPHRLTVRSTGKSKESAGTNVLVDYVIWRSELDYEGERLEVARQTGEKAPSEFASPLFSAGSCVLFPAEKVGDSVTLRIPIYRAGKYPIAAFILKARRYGIFQLKVDGAPLGEPVDGFSNRAMGTERVKFGEVELSAGEHDLTFEALDKNKDAQGYTIGIDSVTLK
ncbi:MAG: DUF2961 domain-containing protein [Armatimonadota bacterium]|nr:DUF2961 domain-containing protein [Armatimonadota bacterium]